MSFIERADSFEELLGEACSRADADLALAGLLADPDLEPFRTATVAALGDVAGPVGSAAIRAQFTSARGQFATAKPHSRSTYRDLMCACLWALGKRDGAAATDVLVEATAHASNDVRDYGLTILAAVGDDRAWDDMERSLAGRLARKITSPRQAVEAVHIIEYLARSGAGNRDRSVRLIGVLRDRWTHLPERAQNAIAELYRGIGPGGPAPAYVYLGTHAPRAPWQPPHRTQPPQDRPLS
jgi:hypothetical protein